MAVTTTEAPADPLGQYRSWASVLFALLAAVALVGGAVVISSTPGPVSVVLFVTVGLAALIFIALALAIGRGDAWAIHAIAPFCVLLIVTGLIRAAVAFGTGTPTLPLELIAAVAVITRDHRPEIMPALDEAGRRRTWLAVGGLVVSQLLPYAAEPAFRGGLLAARAEDLSLTVDVDCARASQPGAPIVVSVAWSLAGTRPFAPPDDGVVVRWNATLEDARPGAGLTLAEHRVSDEETIRMGGSAGPDAQLESFRRAGLPFVDFVISREGAQLSDGDIELDLLPGDVSTAGSIELQAAYAHGDLWIVKSGLASCTW